MEGRAVVVALIRWNETTDPFYLFYLSFLSCPTYWKRSRHVEIVMHWRWNGSDCLFLFFWWKCSLLSICYHHLLKYFLVYVFTFNCCCWYYCYFLLLLYVRRSPELPPPKVARSPAAVSRELSNHSHVYLAVSQRTRNRPRNSHIKSSSWTRNERAREKEERIIEIYLPPQKEERRKKLMREHLHGSIKSVFSRAFC